MFLLSTVQQAQEGWCYGDVEGRCGANRDERSEKRRHGWRRP